MLAVRIYSFAQLRPLHRFNLIPSRSTGKKIENLRMLRLLFEKKATVGVRRVKWHQDPKFRLKTY